MTDACYRVTWVLEIQSQVLNAMQQVLYPLIHPTTSALIFKVEISLLPQKEPSC